MSRLCVLTLPVCFLLQRAVCFSQERQNSLAGPEAAANRREAALELAQPAFELGPTTWSLGLGLELQGSDNIRLESSHPESDLVAHPELHAGMLCPISDNNALQLNLRTGYSAYLDHTEFNRFYIGPESELSFEIYTGDFRINLHDRVSMLENNYQDPTIVGSADFTRLENSAGESTLWDLNKVLLSLAYDHVNYVTYSGAEATTAMPDAASEIVALSAGYHWRPGLLAGTEASLTWFRYKGPISGRNFSDALQSSAGPFVELQLSDYVSGRASGGYSAYFPSENSSFEECQSLYARVDLTHKVNRVLDYTLTGGRNITFALYGGTVDLAYASWRGNWRLIRKLTLATAFSYEHGSDLATGGETFDRYGPGVSFERLLTERMTARLEYQFYSRESDVSGRDYTTNIVMARLTYDF